ncbi:MAG: hypothetical protein HYX48_02595 [Chlamydiales bacterium]|nr:hypothetical protein [Chlamydiales bacterium]
MTIKKIWRKWAPNPFERTLRHAASRNQTRFLIVWNRGLGDIALGLYALTFRIRKQIPDAQITFLTRPDLAEGFSLLKDVELLVIPDWKRGEPCNVEEMLLKVGKSPAAYDLILEKPDPTYWLKWQLGTLTPKLEWREEWDALCNSFSLEKERIYIGIQPQTETGSQYGYEKNWPLSYWKELIELLSLRRDVKIILFGREANMDFSNFDLIDLRGKTSLLEMLSIIKNRCRQLIVPDSGVLSLSYFIDAEFPLHIISLWADPRQGVLKQNVASPNTQLTHTPLIAREGDLRNLSVQEIEGAACSKI